MSDTLIVAYFIQFPTDEEGLTILVEADEEEVDPSTGVEKAGILSRTRQTVAEARVNFDVAVQAVVAENVRALSDAVKNLEVPPNEVELKFGLKATGEFGNIAIAKLGGEATFEIRLLWTKPP